MLVSRRRRGASGRVRTALLDAVARTEGLGLTVVGVYDASIFASTSSWVDARGTTSGGPTLTLTGSPTLSNGVYTFNGTSQYGRAENGRLTELGADHALVVIAATYTPASSVVSAVLSATATTALGAYVDNTPNLRAVITGTGTTVADTAMGAAGVVRVHHTWRASGTLNVRRGAVAAVQVTPTTFTASTVSRITVGASSLDTPSTFGAVPIRTLVIIKGVYSTAAQDIWNQYGALRGATL